ncbi:MAG: hypothetical protein CVV11_12340 [Gammaproteobacteria bacterium HGW-Gammaproteobacteria-15]|nr:MAG: hypothetical protein CVV11_12340 [Gammaproteobacteria bacterium HGW-Gammaproteobacteria-15]
MMLLMLVVIQAIFGGVTAAIAHKKNRSYLGWYLIGAFTGFIGIIVAVFIPPLQQSEGRG